MASIPPSPRAAYTVLVGAAGNEFDETQCRVLQTIKQAIEQARITHGLVITIDTQPHNPPAMGQYDLAIIARNERSR